MDARRRRVNGNDIQINHEAVLMAREEEENSYSQTMEPRWSQYHVPRSDPFGADEQTHSFAIASDD